MRSKRNKLFNYVESLIRHSISRFGEAKSIIVLLMARIYYECPLMNSNNDMSTILRDKHTKHITQLINLLFERLSKNFTCLNNRYEVNGN